MQGIAGCSSTVPQVAHIITTSGLKRTFGAVNAVSGIDLKVPTGSVYGFLGPNGAGKTTTIRMLLGILRPTSGEVFLFNHALQANRPSILARIGSLVEVPSLYPNLTGRENLEIFQRMLGLHRSTVTRSLAVVGLEADARRLVKHYSLGMKQRLGLALAMLGSPELLILDEPTNGLDPGGIIEIREMIRRMPREYGITVFVSSHLLSEMEQVATHIGVIYKGVLLFQGSIDALHQGRQSAVTIEVDDPEEVGRVLADNGWKVKHRGQRFLHVEVSGETDTRRISGLLLRHSIPIYHLSHAKSSLEDSFLELIRAHS